jgi:ATP/maltotriose-dependent transcriptional regulator MalT
MDEVAAFLSQTMGLSLTHEQVASLEVRTEGWIAGVQLAALSQQERGDVADFVAAFLFYKKDRMSFLSSSLIGTNHELP